MPEPIDSNPAPRESLACLKNGMATIPSSASFPEIVAHLRKACLPETVNSTVMHTLRCSMENGQLPFDTNGHWRSGDSFAHLSKEELRRFIIGLSFGWIVSEEAATTLAAALVNGRKLPKPLKLGRGLFVSECPECGNSPLFDTDASVIRATPHCPFPRGIYPIQFDLNVPSGKIVFANDLREWYPVAGNFDVNNNSGLIKTTLNYADEGLAFCFMTHPCHITGFFAVNRIEKEILHLEPLPPRLKGIDQATMPIPMLIPQDDPIQVARIGKIPMQLSWWSAADYDDLRARFGTSDREFKRYVHQNTLVVDVTPGLYRVNHYEDQSLPNNEANVRFDTIPKHSFIIRVGEAKPRENIRELRPHITAGRVIWHSLKKYPEIYFPAETAPSEQATTNTVADLERLISKMNQKEEIAHLAEPQFREAWEKLGKENQLLTLCRVVNHMLLGSSCEWDKDGWCAESPDVNLVDDSVEVPVFPPGMPWSDLTLGFGTLSRAVGLDFIRQGYQNRNAPTNPHGCVEVKTHYMNSSFRELAFNVLQSIIRRGIAPERTGENDFLRECRVKTPEVARIIFDRLVQMYPRDVPSYCADLVKSES